MAISNTRDAMAKKKNPYDDIEKSIDIRAFIDSVKDGFKEVEDPRLADNKCYLDESIGNDFVCRDRRNKFDLRYSLLFTSMQS
jgi:hypothetical protein